MNTSGLIVSVFSILLILNRLLKEKNSQEEASQNIDKKQNSKTKYHHVKFNYSNNKVINRSLLNYYQELLKLSNEPEINLDVIYINYINVLEETESNINIGVMPRHSVYDLISAREYMNEMVKYYGNLN